MRTRSVRPALVLLLALAGLSVLALVAGRGAVSTDVSLAPDHPDEIVVVRPVPQDGEAALYRISNRLPSISARRMISDPGLNTPLRLEENGRKITVTGHLNCARGDEYEVQTSVTQRTTGALARGKSEGRCTGRPDSFSAISWAYDQALFKAGAAQACALMIIRTEGTVSDVFQWCRKEDVELTAARASY